MVLAMYQAIVPSVKNILQCLILFNMPFTFVKGLFSVGSQCLSISTFRKVKGVWGGRKVLGKDAIAIAAFLSFCAKNAIL